MLASLVIAAAGLAELTREESQRFACELALVLAIPFLVFSISYAAFLIVFFRNPMKGRHQTNARACSGPVAHVGDHRRRLLVPVLPFLPEVLAVLKAN